MLGTAKLCHVAVTQIAVCLFIVFADYKLGNHSPEFQRKPENVDRYGPSPGGSLERSSMKPITFAQLDRPATPLLKDGERSMYNEAPHRPPMPNHTDHG